MSFTLQSVEPTTITILDPKPCSSCKRDITYMGKITIQRGSHPEPDKNYQMVFEGCSNCLIDLVEAARDKGIQIGQPNIIQVDYCVCPQKYLLMAGCPRKQGSELCFQEVNYA